MKHHKYHILSNNIPHINADNGPNTQRARAVSGGGREEAAEPNYPPRKTIRCVFCLAHQNRTIAIASDFRVGGAKSPEIPQKEGVLGSDIAARNRKSLATFHRTLESQCSIASFVLSRKSLRFLGSAMGIAIANRKNRCDFSALSLQTSNEAH